MSTYTTYTGPGTSPGALNEILLKEDVSDLITNLYPLDTPLQQLLEKRPMNSVFAEYPVDTFKDIHRNAAFLGSAATPSHADPEVVTTSIVFPQRPEGYIYSSTDAQYPAKLKGVAEIQGLTFEVSGTSRAMSMYGIADRFVYEAMKTTKTVVNNFETSFWWSLGTPPEGGDFDSTDVFNVRQTQGIMSWVLHTGLNRWQAETAGSGYSGDITDGNGNLFGRPGDTAFDSAATIAFNANGLSLDQTMFKQDIMAPWWMLTGRTDGAVAFCSPRVKNLFSQFAHTSLGNVNDRTIAASDKRIIDTIDFYQTDYGTIGLHMCRYLGESSSTTFDVNTATGATNIGANWDQSMLLIHPEYFKIGVVRPVGFSNLAKDGDRERGLILGEQGVLCLNPRAGTAVVNCVA